MLVWFLWVYGYDSMRAWNQFCIETKSPSFPAPLPYLLPTVLHLCRHQVRPILKMAKSPWGIWSLRGLAQICFLVPTSELCPPFPVHLFPMFSLSYSFTQLCQLYLILSLCILALKHKNMVRPCNLYRHEPSTVSLLHLTLISSISSIRFCLFLVK